MARSPVVVNDDYLGHLSSVNCPARAIPKAGYRYGFTEEVPLLKTFTKNIEKKCYNFFMMFFFGKSLESMQKRNQVIVCLLLVGILANGYLWCTLPQVPFVEIRPEQKIIHFNLDHIIVAYGIFVKILVIVFFRKF